MWGRNEETQCCHLFLQGTVLDGCIMYFLEFFFFFLKQLCSPGCTQSCYVAEEDVKLVILLPPPSAGISHTPHTCFMDVGMDPGFLHVRQAN